MEQIRTLGALEMELVRSFASAIGVSLSDEAVARLLRHANSMLEWNERAGLTTITEPAEVATKHIADSLACLLAVDRTAWSRWSVIDIGTGQGYPGLALHAVLSPARMTLVESSMRKSEFLAHVVRECGYENITVATARAEDLARQPQHRGAYDVALARAVAELATLVEICLPFLCLGGMLLAPKSREVADEIRQAQGALRLLGGVVEQTVEYSLPGIEQPRSIVVVRKTKESPDRYPRRAGIPAKRPLR